VAAAAEGGNKTVSEHVASAAEGVEESNNSRVGVERKVGLERNSSVVVAVAALRADNSMAV
jgi:hypothetical protein